MTPRARTYRASRAFDTCGLAALLCIFTGCQSYQREPLDIVAHRAVLAERLTDSEPIRAFAERLRSAGAEAPERFDPADGLSLSEGEVVALLFNPELRLERLRSGITLATYENAGRWDDPILGFDAADIISSAAPLNHGTTLGFTIPISGRLAVERARAGAEHAAGLHRLIDAEWSTRADVRRAWVAWSLADARHGALANTIEQIERIKAITDALEDAGELSRVEARLFRVELAERRAALAATGVGMREARLRLLHVLGLPPNTDVELIPCSAVSEAPDPPDATLRLIESNTMLATRRAEYRVAEEALRLEIRKQYPDLTIGGGYGSEEGDDRLLLGLSVPIPSLNANRQAIAEARAQRALARAEAETTFERLQSELAAARARLDAVQAQQASLESEIVPMLTDQSSEVERIAELGEVDALLLLDTVTRQFDAKNRLLDLTRSEAEARITIAELLGPDDELRPAPVNPDQTTADATAGDER
jgi:outer membrane protein TolC